MTTPSDDTERSRLISDALKLAMEVSKEGASSLSAFLTGIEQPAAEIADQAREQLDAMPTQQFATRTGDLASDAVSVALDVAVAAKRGFDNNPATRDRNVQALSELVGFVGAMFIDTANKAVGTTTGQPETGRPRQVTIPVARNGVAPGAAWIVNRGSSTVQNASVCVVGATDLQSIEPLPSSLTIGPRGRQKVTLTVTDRGSPVGSFHDALLVVEGVGSIVVRVTTVKETDGSTSAAPS